MNSEQIVMCVVALVLGMLLYHMLKGVCGCKVVERMTESIDKLPVLNLDNSNNNMMVASQKNNRCAGNINHLLNKINRLDKIITNAQDVMKKTMDNVNNISINCL